MVASLAPQVDRAQAAPRFRDNRTLQWLCVAAAVVIGISAYHPEMVIDWLLENLLVVIGFAYLIATYKRFPLSNLSYGFILAFLAFHEWGAHFKYFDVPLGEWMKVWLHTSRNHYDRVVHLAFGLLLGYPLHETYARFTGMRLGWAYLFPIETAMGFGAVYECIEATVASIVSPDAGEAFVGMQGDIWDAQKDMGMGMLGGAIAMGALWAYRFFTQDRQGHASAQYGLGLMFDNRQGVSQDHAEAARRYRKSAEQGYASAQFNLGRLFDQGKGVPQEYAEAVAWYRKAAEQGDAIAQRVLGLMHAIGKGLPQDYDEAVKWLRKAADQGDTMAQSGLGILHRNGQGVPRNDTEAAEWYRKAAE